MDEPSKVIRDRNHFSLLRAVISPEIFRFPFDKTDAKPKGVGLRSLALRSLALRSLGLRSLALSCLS